MIAIGLFSAIARERANLAEAVLDALGSAAVTCEQVGAAIAKEWGECDDVHSLKNWSTHIAPVPARNHDRRASGGWHVTHAIEVSLAHRLELRISPLRCAPSPSASKRGIGRYTVRDDCSCCMLKRVFVLWLVGSGRVGNADSSADKNISDSQIPWISTPQCVLPAARPNWCPVRASEDAVQICIDAQTGCMGAAPSNALSSTSTQLILPPNRDVMVIVHNDGCGRDDISDVSVSLAGSVGLVLPVTYGDSKASNVDQSKSLNDPPGFPSCRQQLSYVARFGPRGAGPLPLPSRFSMKRRHHRQNASLGRRLLIRLRADRAARSTARSANRPRAISRRHPAQ